MAGITPQQEIIQGTERLLTTQTNLGLKYLLSQHFKNIPPIGGFFVTGS